MVADATLIYKQMEKEKFKVLLYLKKGSTDKSGNTPIMGRVTVGRSVAQFSCKISCAEKLWNARESRLNGKSKIAVATNVKISSLLLTINEAYAALIAINKPFSAADLKDRIQGNAAAQMTIVQLFDRVYREVLARVGVDFAQATPRTYKSVLSSLQLFIELKYRCSDLSFGQLNEQFIRDYCDYVILEKGFSKRTLHRDVTLIKKICKIAYREGYADKCHFAYFNIPREKVRTPRALSREQFEAIRDLEIEPMDQSHNLVRDMFIFSCYVGSAYTDTVALKKENLITDENGAQWLRYNRNKNGSLSRVKLLPEALVIIEKYNVVHRDTIFPYIQYSPLRCAMQGIRSAIGMRENLSYHQSRHSFASLITLDQGVPIETVSKMLGHSNITTTQIYARVTPRKLFEDMNIYIEKTKDLKLTL